MFHVKHRARRRAKTRPAGTQGSNENARAKGGFYAEMFHVKHRGDGPENTILQNNPMHQKIGL